MLFVHIALICNFLFIVGNCSIEQRCSESKHDGNDQQLQPIPKRFPWLVGFSSGNCTSRWATESTDYRYLGVSIEASRIKPVANDNQCDGYHHDCCGDYNSNPMFLYLLPP